MQRVSAHVKPILLKVGFDILPRWGVLAVHVHQLRDRLWLRLIDAKLGDGDLEAVMKVR